MAHGDNQALLHQRGVEFVFCTLCVGVNPALKTMDFYKHKVSDDALRVSKLFASAPEAGIRLAEGSVSAECLKQLVLSEEAPWRCRAYSTVPLCIHCPCRLPPHRASLQPSLTLRAPFPPPQAMRSHLHLPPMLCLACTVLGPHFALPSALRRPPLALRLLSASNRRC